MMPQEIQAARLRLVKERPYLASAAYALRPVERPGLGTLAVDMWWRLYYDTAVTEKWTVEELTGVLYHEICHLLRDHASRMKGFSRTVANIATDAEINDDLISEGFSLPGTPVTPESIGGNTGLFAEEYAELLQGQEQASAQGTSAQPGQQTASTGTGEPEAGDTQQGDGSSEAGQQHAGDGDTETAQENTAPSDACPGSAEGNGSNPSPTPEGGGQADDSHSGDGGNGPSSEAGDVSGSKPSDGGNSMSPSSSGQPGTSSAQPGSSSQPSDGSVSSRTAGSSGTSSEEQGSAPAPGAGRCGSCATGQPEEWEEGPPQDGDGVLPAEAELIRRDVARRIKEHSKSRGSVPGHLERWANEKLRPKVDWRKQLASAIRHAVADVAGAVDYSYRRPSRRQGQVGNGKVVLPSLRQPVPEVAVVVDTSGSMSDSMLSQALAEVSGVLKSCGLRQGITVLAVDSAVNSAKRVFDARQVELAGGGGTDMGEGLAQVEKMKPRPQVAIVITDGYTPWPDRPPRGTKVIVGLLGDGEAPSWAKEVKIDGYACG